MRISIFFFYRLVDYATRHVCAKFYGEPPHAFNDPPPPPPRPQNNQKSTAWLGFIWYMWPPNGVHGQGEGPKGPNVANFKLLSPDPIKVEQ